MTPVLRAKEIDKTLNDPKFKVFADEVLQLYKHECHCIGKLLDTPGQALVEVEVARLNYHRARRRCFADILSIKRSLEDELSTFLEETSLDADNVKDTAEEN